MAAEFFGKFLPFSEKFFNFISPEKKAKLKLVDAAIDEAREWCKNLRVNYTLWKGVDYETDRREQVKASVKEYLTGYPSKIEGTNDVRWEEFRSLAHQHITKKWLVSPKHDDFQWVSRIESVLHGQAKDAGFVSAATTEHEPFLQFVDWYCSHNKNEFTWIDAARELTYQEVSQIAADFLTMHVGHRHHRRVTEDRAGFDQLPGKTAKQTTCPVAMTPGIGMQYFAQTAAQYIKMRAIQEQYWDGTLFAYPDFNPEEDE